MFFLDFLWWIDFFVFSNKCKEFFVIIKSHSNFIQLKTVLHLPKKLFIYASMKVP